MIYSSPEPGAVPSTGSPTPYRAPAKFGLTIISLRTSSDSQLIDMDGNVVKTWHGADVPTEFAYMLPDSSILRPCRVPDAEGRGGRIQRIDTNDVVVWDYLFADLDYLQHHRFFP